MLTWNIKDNVIHSLMIDGQNMIHPWGVETADSWAFFSLENAVGYRYVVQSFEHHLDERCYKTNQVVKMKEGLWRLETSDILSENKITRTAILTCLSDSFFMDFVLRFRFKSAFFPGAIIAGKKFTHLGTNIYHQHPVAEAALKGDKREVKIKIIEAQCAGKFKPHLYVRDRGDEWIVHARMLPLASDKDVIKLCSRYFKTSPLPDSISRALLSSTEIKNYLWYKAEHAPYKSRLARFFSPNAFPLVKLRKGEQLKWVVEASF